MSSYRDEIYSQYKHAACENCGDVDGDICIALVYGEIEVSCNKCGYMLHVESAEGDEVEQRVRY